LLNDCQLKVAVEMTSLQTIILLAVCFAQSKTSKILVMSVHGSSSHIGSMLPFVYNIFESQHFCRLAQAGHSITILETNDRREATDFGNGIKTEHIYIPDDAKHREAYFVFQARSKIWWQNSPTRRCSVCRMPMSLSSTTELAYEPTKFAHRVGSAFEHITEYIGLRYFTMNCSESVSIELEMIPVQWFGMPHLREIGVSNFEWIKFFEGVSALLGDSLINIPHPTPQGTEMVNVGSVCTKANGPLPPDIEDFLNARASKGTILVAFGNHVDWRAAPNFVVEVFFETMTEFTDYRIVFAYNATVKNVPKHIKIVPFAPQKQILNHNRTKIFIGHAGLKSIKESICAQVPLLLMPIFAEQAHNALIAHQLGIAETMNKRKLTKQIFTEQLTKVLNDRKYIGNIKKVKALWLDRVIPAMDHALFITEKILKNPRKAINFKRKGIHIAWMQFIYVDLLIALLFIVAVVFN
uniref:glucuronosyltransferase n=1 Tax=Anisakis simplex TaxID=6269 RepID=A0A0M3JZN4_ANISI